MPDTTQTNIATEITRIQNDRNTIRTKLVELGMAESTSNLDTLATVTPSMLATPCLFILVPVLSKPRHSCRGGSRDEHFSSVGPPFANRVRDS